MAKEPKDVTKFRAKLQPGETVLDFLQGYVGEMMGSGKDAQVNGALVITNKRVVFYSKGFFKEVQETIQLDRISSVETTKKLMVQLVKIFTSGNTLEFKSLEPAKAVAVADKIQNLLDTKSTGAKSNAVTSVADEIGKLAKLRETGALTEAEFSEAKGKLLKAG